MGTPTKRHIRFTPGEEHRGRALAQLKNAEKFLCGSMAVQTRTLQSKNIEVRQSHEQDFFSILSFSFFLLLFLFFLLLRLLLRFFCYFFFFFFFRLFLSELLFGCIKENCIERQRRSPVYSYASPPLCFFTTLQGHNI